MVVATDPRQTSVTLPQRGSVERQRGAHSRIGIDVTFALLRCVVLGSTRSRLTAEDFPMTTQKDFKRLVRGRMQKTGESYTAARATLLAQRPPANGAVRRPVVAAPPAPDYATLAGMSDAKIKEQTGCTWEKWVKALDYAGAHEWPHREIARYVREKYDTPDWWTQTVAVGYERIKGLRAIGQRRSGTWEASRSKTFAVSVSALFKAFSQPRIRSKWLGPERLAVRRSTPNKSMRITWPDGTSVELGFASKGRSRSTVAIQHSKLPSREDADRVKAYWAEKLAALGALLEE